MCLLLNAPPSLLFGPRLSRLRPIRLFRVALNGKVLCLEFSPDIRRKHRKMNAHLALNKTHFACLLEVDFPEREAAASIFIKKNAR
jgi:hypothetical protein